MHRVTSATAALAVLLLTALCSAANADEWTSASDDDAKKPGTVMTARLFTDFSMSGRMNFGRGDRGAMFSYDSSDDFTLSVSGPNQPTLAIGVKSVLGGRVMSEDASVLGDSREFGGVDIVGWIIAPVNDTTAVIAGGSLGVWFALDAEVFDRTWTGWLWGGAQIKPGPRLTIKLGLHVFFALRETAAWPLLDIDWRPDDDWQLRCDGWSVSLLRRIGSAWLGLRGGYSSSQYRMDDEYSPAPDGIWYEQSAVAEVRLEFNVGVLEVKLSLGARIWHEVRLLDRDADRLDAVRVGPAPYGMFALALNF